MYIYKYKTIYFALDSYKDAWQNIIAKFRLLLTASISNSFSFNYNTIASTMASLVPSVEALIKACNSNNPGSPIMGDVSLNGADLIIVNDGTIAKILNEFVQNEDIGYWDAST